jgi:hypothetical protein
VQFIQHHHQSGRHRISLPFDEMRLAREVNHCDIEICGTENTGKNWNGIQAGCLNDCQNEIEEFALSH